MAGCLLPCGAVLVTGGLLLPRSPQGSAGHGTARRFLLPLLFGGSSRVSAVGDGWRKRQSAGVCWKLGGRCLSRNASGISEAREAVCCRCVPERLRLSFSCPALLGEGNGSPVQCSCLENPMDKGAWRATVHRVAEGCTRLSGFTLPSELSDQ